MKDRGVGSADLARCFVWDCNRLSWSLFHAVITAALGTAESHSVYLALFSVHQSDAERPQEYSTVCSLALSSGGALTTWPMRGASTTFNRTHLFIIGYL